MTLAEGTGLSVLVVASGVAGAVLAWTLARHRTPGVVSLAREWMVEDTQDAMFVVDTRQRIVDLNPAASELIGGLCRADAIGRQAAQVFAFPPSLLEGGTVKREAEIEAAPNEGDGMRSFRVRALPLVTSRGRPRGQLLVVYDLMEQVRRERALHEARDAVEAANRAKHVFLDGMSHELRTPLNAILGFSQLMASDRSLSERQKQDLDVIHRSGERLLSFINNVLDAANVGASAILLPEQAQDAVRPVDGADDLMGRLEIVAPRDANTECPDVEAPPSDHPAGTVDGGLQAMSSAWRSEMAQALKEGDVLAITCLVDGLRAHDPDLGRYLACLVDAFAFDQILDLISK